MKENCTERPVRVGLISLGCAKNLVDGEIMLGTLLRDGVEITNDAAEADVVIVNTCSFIDSAQQESVDTILESDQVREASEARCRLSALGRRAASKAASASLILAPADRCSASASASSSCERRSSPTEPCDV